MVVQEMFASQVVLMIKNPPASVGDPGDPSLIPGLRRSPGGGNGSVFQYFCLKNSMDRETWQVLKSPIFH